MTRTITASDVTPKPPPTCPDCGKPMVYYGGTGGWIHCETKILHRAGGWFKSGVHVTDDERLTGQRDYAAIRER
jgi:hypothetical protein